MRTNSKKLDELHEYFINGGSTKDADILAQLGTEDNEAVKAYKAALRAKYPDVYGEEEKPEEAQTFQLLDPDTKLMRPLDIVKVKGSKTILEVREPKELVTIMVGGEELEVDLIKLRKKDPESTLGTHKVSTVLMAAELAKG